MWFKGVRGRKLPDLIEERQEWLTQTRYMITAGEMGSVQLVLYNRNEPTHLRNKACIYNLWVNKSFRKEGMGTMLLKRAEEIAQRHGYRFVYLNWIPCDDEQLWTCDWYIRQNYNGTQMLDGTIQFEKELTIKVANIEDIIE